MNLFPVGRKRGLDKMVSCRDGKPEAHAHNGELVTLSRHVSLTRACAEMDSGSNASCFNFINQTGCKLFFVVETTNTNFGGKGSKSSMHFIPPSVSDFSAVLHGVLQSSVFVCVDFCKGLGSIHPTTMFFLTFIQDTPPFHPASATLP